MKSLIHSSKDVSQKLAIKPLMLAVSVSLLTVTLSGCGGGSNDDNNKNNNNPSDNQTSTSSFSKSATWNVDFKKQGETCYDFDAPAQVECTDDKWDVKFKREGYIPSLWTNGGISGKGKGAAFYLMPWSQAAELKSAQEVPPFGFKADIGTGVFANNPWYAYNINDQHKISPNNRVYLITTNAEDSTSTSTASQPIYAMQIINYYDEAGKPGSPTIRWIDTAMPTSTPNTKTVNTTKGWVYVNLKTGETTNKDGDWHVGFDRTDVILNGGLNGSGKVGGYLAKTPAGYYETDENGKLKAVKAKFLENNVEASLADLTDVNSYDITANGVQWETDVTPTSQLNKTNSYSWYSYNPATHMLTAQSQDNKDKAAGALIRSAEGNSYARMYLEEIKYEDPNDATSISEWVYKLDIQPASK